MDLEVGTELRCSSGRRWAIVRAPVGVVGTSSLRINLMWCEWNVDACVGVGVVDAAAVVAAAAAPAEGLLGERGVWGIDLQTGDVCCDGAERPAPRGFRSVWELDVVDVAFDASARALSVVIASGGELLPMWAGVPPAIDATLHFFVQVEAGSRVVVQFVRMGPGGEARARRGRAGTCCLLARGCVPSLSPAHRAAAQSRRTRVGSLGSVLSVSLAARRPVTLKLWRRRLRSKSG